MHTVGISHKTGDHDGTIYGSAKESSRATIRRVAFIVCIATAGLATSLTVLNLAQGYHGWDLYFLPPIFVVSLIAAFLIHRGRVTAGAALLAAGLMVVIGVEPYFILDSPIALAMYFSANGLGFAVSILLSGLFVRGALLAVVTLASAADIVVLAVLSRSREIQVSAPYVVLGLLACGALTLLFSRVFRGALAAAREEERKAASLREQLLHAQKMEALGRFAGGIAHDFNNVLAAIGARADLALVEATGTPEMRTPMGEIRDYVDKAAAMVRRLLLFSRKTPTGDAAFDTVECIRGLEGMLQRLLGGAVTLSVTAGSGPIPVRGDQVQFEQVVMNLVVNARDAMPDGGRIDVELGRADDLPPGATTTPPLEPGSYAFLCVRDTGVGMSLEVKERLFEPFFTTKPEGVGTGLGLSTVYAIVSGAGGGISVQSEPGAGSTFTLYFPCA